MSNFYTLAQHLPPLGQSDHQCLLLHPKISNKLPPVSTKVRLRTPENIQILNRNFARQNWDSVFAVGDVDQHI